MQKTILVISMLFLSNVASAACTRPDFTGSWKLYTMFPGVGRCTLVIPVSGTTMSTSSSCVVPGMAALTLRGTLSIAADCHVTGSIKVAGYSKSIDGWISKGKDSISGISWTPGNVADGFMITGIKQ
jgi:hypothetical protein